MAEITPITGMLACERVSRRKILKGMAGLAGLALIGAACTPSTPEPSKPAGEPQPGAEEPPAAATPAPAEQVELNVWWGINPTTDGVVQVYEEQHPGVKIALSDLGEAVYGTPKYVTAVAAGSGPDVAYQNRHTFGQFASLNLYRPIDELMARDGIKKEDFMAGPIVDLTWEGVLYGLPHTAGTRYFFWNRKHFEEAGLDPDKGPETWEELEDMLPKLNQESGGRTSRYGFLPNFPPGLADQLLIYAIENGGQTLDEEGKQVLIDTDPWVEALTWCVDIVDKYAGGYASAASFMEGFAGQPVDPFAQGQVSMCSYGDWMIGDYARFPELDYDGTGQMPVPMSKKGTKINWSCGWTFIIDPNTDLVEPGWEFLKWVIGPEYVMAAGTVGLQLETEEWKRQQLPGDPIFAPTPPVYKPAMEVMDKEFYSKLPERQKLMRQRYLEAEDFSIGCGQLAGLAAAEMWTGFKNAWEAALTGKSAPKQALADAKVDVQKALDSAWEKLAQ